jgi:hypothetical protein
VDYRPAKALEVRQDIVARHKRIWALTAVGVTSMLGVGTAVGLTAANASTPAAAGARISPVSAVISGTTRDAAHRTTLLRFGTTRAAVLKARRVKVIKVVLAKFPKAKVLVVTLRRDGTWLVALQLKDHRVGIVRVDRHFKVGPFKKLPTKITIIIHPAHGYAAPSSQIGKIGGDSAVSGHHW